MYSSTRPRINAPRPAMEVSSVHPANRLPWPGIIAAFAFLLYANTLTHQFALDDYHVILSNSYVQMGVKGIVSIWSRPTWYSGIQYRPLPATMFAIERELGNGSPAPGHWINVALYAICCGLLTLILLRLLGKERRFIALAASLLYAAHPVHTEVVANIKSRDEILCLLALLGTLACLRGYAGTRGSRGRRIGWLLAATLAFAAGLFTKESALTFIAVVPMTLFFFTQASPRKLLVMTGVLLAAGAAYLVFAVFAIGSLAGYTADTPLNNALVAAHSVGDRVATALFMQVRYLRLLIFPHPLVNDYGYNQISIVNYLSFRAALSVVVTGGLVVYATVKARTRSIPAFGILFFAVTVSLSSNIVVLIGATMGERFLFIPSLGFCVILAYAMAQAVVLLRIPYPAVKALVAVILIAFSLKTLSRNADWKDNLTLFSRDIVHTANSATANASLGNMLIITGQPMNDTSDQRRIFQQAVHRLRAAIRIFPDYAYAEGNLGLAFDFLGDTDSALVHYRTALRLEPHDVVAAMNIAGVYVRKREFDSAIAVLEHASSVAPGNDGIRKQMEIIRRLRLKGVEDTHSLRMRETPATNQAPFLPAGSGAPHRPRSRPAYFSVSSNRHFALAKELPIGRSRSPRKESHTNSRT